MTAKKIVRRVAERLQADAGCSDHNCVYGHAGGMGTNGGCQCLKDRNPAVLMRHIMQLSRVAHTLAATQAFDVDAFIAGLTSTDGTAIDDTHGAIHVVREAAKLAAKGSP